MQVQQDENSAGSRSSEEIEIFEDEDGVTIEEEVLVGYPDDHEVVEDHDGEDGDVVVEEEIHVGYDDDDDDDDVEEQKVPEQDEEEEAKFEEEFIDSDGEFGDDEHGEYGNDTEMAYEEFDGVLKGEGEEKKDDDGPNTVVPRDPSTGSLPPELTDSFPFNPRRDPSTGSHSLVMSTDTISTVNKISDDSLQIQPDSNSQLNADNGGIPREPKRSVSFGDVDEMPLGMVREPSSISIGPPDPVRKSLDDPDEAPEDKCLSKVSTLILLGLCVGLSLAGIVTGVTLGVLKPWENKTDAPTVAPTYDGSAPPTIPCSELEKPSNEVLAALFASVVGDAVYETDTTYSNAAYWVLNEDPRTNGPPCEIEYLSNEEYIQRFLMVHLYYATTVNRNGEWFSCNPPPEGEDEIDCLYQKLTGTTEDGNLIYTPIPATRWLTRTHECDWAGLTCKTLGNGGPLVVTVVDLAGQRLSGVLPTDILYLPDLKTWKFAQNDFVGELVEDLQVLDSLDLSYNLLEGTLPTVLGRLTNLELEKNRFEGNIPDELFIYSTPLERFNVGSNRLTGSFPESVSFALQLKELSIMDNQLFGSIPFELGQLPLTVFRASGNSFEGPLPLDSVNAAWFPTLETLWLHENAFTGTIPEVVGEISRLQDLRLSGNALVGRVPDGVYELERLFRFEVADNGLTGTIPSSISQMSALEVYNMNSNQFSGPLDGLNSLIQLRQVQVQFNSFTGTVPGTLCDFVGDTLEVLVADCLPESAPINPCFCCTECCDPEDKVCVASDVAETPKSEIAEIRTWARQTFGTSIDVAQGSPHDSTIRWIADSDSLQLSLDDPTFLQRYTMALFYYMTGPWLSCNPEPTTSCLYQELVIDENEILIGYDGVPATRWLAPVSECEWVGISCNDEGQVSGIALAGQSLSGSLPNELLMIPTLEVISLPHNELSGAIPSGFGSLPNLIVFQLGSNQLTGNIPSAFFDTFNALEIFDVSSNLLNGTLPETMNGPINLQQLHIGSNSLTGLIPLSIEQLPQLETLRLNRNIFVGTIPPGVFGLLTNLEEIWLQDNGFQGVVPNEVGALRQLSDLRLSGNALSGSFPAGLFQLGESLRILHLDDNNMNGFLEAEGFSSLTNLEELQLDGNFFAGDVPDTIGNMVNLTVALFQGNEFSGTMPQTICFLPNIEFLQADCEQIECPCCTACCDALGECATPI